MKTILENWNKFLAEEDEQQKPEDQEQSGFLNSIGASIAKAWRQADDAMKQDYCMKKIPGYLKSAEDLKTWGDLQALLRCTTEYRDKKQVLSKLIAWVPWVGQAQEAFTQASDTGGFITAAYQTDDSNRPGGALGKLDMDDDVSSIIDDKIENAFIKFLINRISSPDVAEQPIPSDWNVTKELQDWLAKHKNSRTVTGFGK